MFIPEPAKSNIRHLIIQYFKNEFEKHLKLEQKRLLAEKKKQEEDIRLSQIKQQIKEIYSNNKI